jgi:hypothetical protein
VLVPNTPVTEKNSIDHNVKYRIAPLPLYGYMPDYGIINNSDVMPFLAVYPAFSIRMNNNRLHLPELGGKAPFHRNKRRNNRLVLVSVTRHNFYIHKTTGMHRSAWFQFPDGHIQGR